MSFTSSGAGNPPLDPMHSSLDHMSPMFNFGDTVLPTGSSSAGFVSSPNVMGQPTRSIESLELPDLMRNRHVLSMYNSWKATEEMQQSLWKRYVRICSEVDSLKADAQQFRCVSNPTLT
jgi:hypothetical protein